MTFTVDNNNDNNNITNSAEEFEIDVDAIYTMASLAREWFVAHESGTEALTILKEAKEELSSMLKKKKEKKDKKKNENEDFSSSPYHVKVQEKIKSIFPSDDMLNCLMKRGKYANFSSAADAERVDEACEKLRRIVEELESISKRMEETFESFTSAFENGGKEVQEVKEEEEKNPPEHLARRDEEKEEGHGRQGRDREPRGRRRSRSRSSRGRDRRRGKETEQKEDEAEEAVVLAKRLSFLETTKKEQTDDEAPSPKVHWMHNVPNAALSTRFSLSNTTVEMNNNNNKRSFEQWLFLCASALEGTRKELRVKQVVAEKALDSLRGSFSSSNTNTSNSTRSHTEEGEEKEDNNGVLLFDSLLDAWDVQAFVDDDAFRALSSESAE